MMITRTEKDGALNAYLEATEDFETEVVECGICRKKYVILKGEEDSGYCWECEEYNG